MQPDIPPIDDEDDPFKRALAAAQAESDALAPAPPMRTAPAPIVSPQRTVPYQYRNGVDDLMAAAAARRQDIAPPPQVESVSPVALGLAGVLDVLANRGRNLGGIVQTMAAAPRAAEQENYRRGLTYQQQVGDEQAQRLQDALRMRGVEDTEAGRVDEQQRLEAQADAMAAKGRADEAAAIRRRAQELADRTDKRGYDQAEDDRRAARDQTNRLALKRAGKGGGGGGDGASGASSVDSALAVVRGYAEHGEISNGAALTARLDAARELPGKQRAAYVQAVLDDADTERRQRTQPDVANDAEKRRGLQMEEDALREMLPKLRGLAKQDPSGRFPGTGGVLSRGIDRATEFIGGEGASMTPDQAFVQSRVAVAGQGSYRSATGQVANQVQEQETSKRLFMGDGTYGAMLNNVEARLKTIEGRKAATTPGGAPPPSGKRRSNLGGSAPQASTTSIAGSKPAGSW